MNFYDIFSSDIGDLLVVCSEHGLKLVHFSTSTKTIAIDPNWIKDTHKTKEVREQLLAYFNKERTCFDLQLAPEGTVFQRQIWKQLLEIPYGQTCSYQDIANAIQKPTACRAVGMANSLNPIPIIIPCHRVIGKNGKLTGYAGGLEAKAKLLALENIQLSSTNTQYQLF